MTTLEKWKRATIHLECAADSVQADERFAQTRDLIRLHQRGKISDAQLQNEMSKGVRDIRYQGTALFVLHSGRRYLLTARHVVWDETSAIQYFEQEKKRIIASYPAERHADELRSAEMQAENTIFKIVFRVPSFDEFIANHDAPPALMNLGAGAHPFRPYIFSPRELDLAVISLDQRVGDFAENLIACGYVPISSDEISDGPDAEGQEILTIGFPGATSIIGRIEQTPHDAHWASPSVSLPVTSFGRVSRLHGRLPFFWADMSIYPGNSGGPVIGNDRLVGIVSSQAAIPVEGAQGLATRIPFANIAKAQYVRALLNKLAEIDNATSDPSKIIEYLHAKKLS
ncbi:trypsin-like serine peptidase [Burkholderia anthina]|uniref:trypsin-like serine peptidase n=1 Tax=Burkholderia anthina TaxID=179879 RepID=UPI0015884EA7|nr:serine protease [Burkholderia anthina]